MTVVSSKNKLNTPQKDGRIWVDEYHTLEDGSVRERHFLADPGLDFDAHLALTAQQINEELALKAEQEAVIEANKQEVETKIGTLGEKLLDAAMAEFSKIDPNAWQKDPRGSVARLLATGLVEDAKEEIRRVKP